MASAISLAIASVGRLAASYSAISFLIATVMALPIPSLPLFQCAQPVTQAEGCHPRTCINSRAFHTTACPGMAGMFRKPPMRLREILAKTQGDDGLSADVRQSSHFRTSRRLDGFATARD